MRAPGVFLFYIGISPPVCILIYLFPDYILFIYSFSRIIYVDVSLFGLSPIILGVILFRSLGEQKEKGSATQEKNLLQSSVQIKNLNPVLSFVLIKGASLRYI